MAEFKKKSKKQVDINKEIRRFGVLIEHLDDSVDKLLKKMKEKS